MDVSHNLIEPRMSNLEVPRAVDALLRPKLDALATYCIQCELPRQELCLGAAAVGDKPADRLTAITAELWKSYAAAAQDVANQNQLLVGDDAGWADFAARRGAANPIAGRALFAYLAQQSKVRADILHATCRPAPRIPEIWKRQIPASSRTAQQSPRCSKSPPDDSGKGRAFRRCF